MSECCKFDFRYSSGTCLLYYWWGPRTWLVLTCPSLAWGRGSALKSAWSSTPFYGFFANLAVSFTLNYSYFWKHEFRCCWYRITGSLVAYLNFVMSSWLQRFRIILACGRFFYCHPWQWWNHPAYETAWSAAVAGNSAADSGSSNFGFSMYRLLYSPHIVLYCYNLGSAGPDRSTLSVYTDLDYWDRLVERLYASLLPDANPTCSLLSGTAS